MPIASAATPELTNKERNILAKEAKAVDLKEVLITDSSWNKLPVYKDRQFWEALPGKHPSRNILREPRSYLDLCAGQ
ncbi:MAG: hypothetical protein MZV63_16250 [Marinilabiliales bacterium]|nr:hypothetical protein [Marinilabiliales bacterium]